jgi:hypothetical protein
MTSRAVWMGLGVVLLAASGAWAQKGSASKQRAETLAGEAKALANPRGCDKVEQCVLADFGNKPCGGPREYLPYCSRTTDEKALQAKLDSLKEAERQWQTEAGLLSNCGLTRKPLLRFVDGECRAR